MYCTNCGATLVGEAKFCNQCGQKVVGTLSPRVCLSCASSLAQGAVTCAACGARHQSCPGCGRLLLETALGCPGCGRLLRLPAGYGLVPGEFEHPSMQQMNQALRRSLVLNRLAESVSQKIGKPWYESCFNSVQATEKQYGRIYELAMIAARRIGFTQVPSVYIEADRGYQSNTYGSEKDSFVNVGTFLPKLLTDRELLFILGHEFGHLKCRHALWTTVSMFLVGQTRGNLMSDGVMSFVSNPLKIIESGVESAISSWMRVAELTADRAALLVSGDIALARRTLFLLYFRSRRELDEVDVNEWAQQQEAQASTMTKVSQLMTSSTPYLGLRLRALDEFYRSPLYAELRDKVETGSGLDIAPLFDERGSLKKFAKAAKIPGAPVRSGEPVRIISGKCPHCRADVRIPLRGLSAAGPTPITCGRCGKTFPVDIDRILGRKPAAPAPPPPPGKPAAGKVQVVAGDCPACGLAFTIPFTALPDKTAVVVRCKRCRKPFRVNIDSIRKQGAPGPG
jgi:Zn-dependent protease with chaperone function